MLGHEWIRSNHQNWQGPCEQWAWFSMVKGQQWFFPNHIQKYLECKIWKGWHWKFVRSSGGYYHSPTKSVNVYQRGNNLISEIEEEFELFCDILAKYCITANLLSLSNVEEDSFELTREQCATLIKVLKPARVSIDSRGSNRIEALLHLNHQVRSITNGYWIQGFKFGGASPLRDQVWRLPGPVAERLFRWKLIIIFTLSCSLFIF